MRTRSLVAKHPSADRSSVMARAKRKREPCVGVKEEKGMQDLKRNRTGPRSKKNPRCVDLPKGVREVDKPDSETQKPAGECGDYVSQLSLEILCRIMRKLSLCDVMKLEHLSQQLQEAVSMHLRLLTVVDFTEGQLYGWMPDGITDRILTRFLARCTDVVHIHGLHPHSIVKRRQSDDSQLSIAGVTDALRQCAKLKYVDTCDIFLLESLLFHLPHICFKVFKNRSGTFPIPPSNRFELTRNCRITSLHLSGVTIPELPRMEYLKHLHLQWVQLSLPHPFREFGVPQLRSFVMTNCAGPANTLSYVPLITALAVSPNLSRLELTRVPFLGGLVQHVVEDNWRVGSFRQLSRILMAACRHALEVDLGYLVITCASSLVELGIQPSLTKDSFFASLSMAEVLFPTFETLRLGYTDSFPEPGQWSNEELVAQGLADCVESPAMITDLGMQAVGKVFPECRSLSIYNCPHLHMPLVWFVPENRSWSRLKELHLRRCHAQLLNEFRKVIPQMVSLENLILEQMFREPPKGCSRVGLSAGTGLGVSSALVQNSHNDVANQDLVNNNAPGPGANQQGPLNQPLLQPPPPPPAPPPPLDDDDDEDDDIHEDMEVEALLEQAPANQFIADAAPANHIILGDEAANNNEVAAGPANQNQENQVNNNEHGAGPANHNNPADENEADEAGPANQEEAEVLPEFLPNNAENPAGGNEPEIAPIPRPAEGMANNVNNNADSDSEEEINNIICTCGQRPSRYRAYVVARGTGRIIAKQQQCDGASASADTTDCKPGCSKQNTDSSRKELRRSSRIMKSKNCDNNDNNSPKGKGKSNKNFIAKKSKFNKQVHQYCQASCEEIRETTKKAKEKEEAARQGARTRSTRAAQASTSRAGGAGEAQPPPGIRSLLAQSQAAKKSTKKKPNMVDKATSTSDPVIEEDHIQILTIRSSSLKNLTLREVGITDLMLHDCPKLQSVNGSACRVLRDVLIKNAPQLTRMSFTQCPKLRNEDLVDEVSMQPPEKDRVIMLRPIWLRPPSGVLAYNITFDRYSRYNPRNLEAELFRSTLCNYHICIIHDYSLNPENTLYNRMRAAAWPELMTKINAVLLSSYGFQKAKKTAENEFDPKRRYPWNRQIYRLYGRFEPPKKLRSGSVSPANSWSVLTDLPWLRTLATAGAIGTAADGHDTRPGLYDPAEMGHQNMDTVLDLLTHEIAEAHESRIPLYAHTLMVYVNMCDIDGVPKQDCYV